MKLISLIAFLYMLNFAAYSQRSPAPDVIKIEEVATSKSYGMKKKTNIKVGSIDNEYQYIAQLTGPNGEQITAYRLGSCCNVKAPNAPFGKAPLDMWQISYEGLEEPIVLYLNAYDYDKPKCPAMLSFKRK